MQPGSIQGSKFRRRVLVGHFDAWWWGHNIAWKCWDPITHWRNVMSQKNKAPKMTRLGECDGNTMKSNYDIRKFFLLRCQNNLAPKFSLKINESIALFPISEDFPPKKHENVTTQKMFHQFGMFLHQDFKKFSILAMCFRCTVTI